MSELTDGSSGTEGGLPDALAKVVGNGEITAEDEMGALDFLLGPTVALQYDLPVDYETPIGIKKLTVRFQQLDPETLEGHDASNRRGDGPFAKLDVFGFSADVCAAAIISISDGKQEVGLSSEKFRGGMPGGPGLALRARFKYQGGLLEGIAEEVKRVSGFTPDRIGTAQRVFVEAGKAS